MGVRISKHNSDGGYNQKRQKASRGYVFQKKNQMGSGETESQERTRDSACSGVRDRERVVSNTVYTQNLHGWRTERRMVLRLTCVARSYMASHMRAVCTAHYGIWPHTAVVAGFSPIALRRLQTLDLVARVVWVLQCHGS